jgi:FMN reductase
MISARPFIVGIGGTLRLNSSSECALKISPRAAEYHGAETLLITGRELSLPMYEPGAGHTVGVERTVDAFRGCDGVIVTSPAYTAQSQVCSRTHWTMPRSCGRMHEPTSTAWPSAVFLVQAAGRRADTLAALRAIVHALRGWPTPLGVALNTSTKLFDENGNCVDSTMMSQLETVGQQVVEFANWRRFALTRPAPLRNQGVENTKAQYLAPDVRNKAGSPSSSGT